MTHYFFFTEHFVHLNSTFCTLENFFYLVPPSRWMFTISKCQLALLLVFQ